MARWFMEIVSGLFSIWDDESFDDESGWGDPLASVTPSA
jgi:hypothetical protein